MNILIVCQYFHPEPFRVTDLAVELRKAGHRVRVLAGMPNYPSGRFYDGYGPFKGMRGSYEGVSVRRAPLVPRGNGKGRELALNYLSFAVTGTLEAMKTRRGDYDVVLVYQLSPVTMALPGIVASRRAHVPLLLYVMDLWPESLSASGGISSGKVISLVGKLVAHIYRRSARILVSSEGFIKPILARGVQPGKLSFVPQYPESVYRPITTAPDEISHDEVPRGFVVVFTGNIGEAQGLETMVLAAEELSNIQDLYWLVIGDGRSRERIQGMAKARGLEGKIRFLGKKPMENIPSYLSLCDVALLPFKKDPLFALTLPAKLQSYLACGMPIVGCVDGDPARVIEESGAGLCGPAGDSAALAANVRRFYAMGSSELRRYSERALAYNDRNFKKEIVLERIVGELRHASIARDHTEKE